MIHSSRRAARVESLELRTLLNGGPIATLTARGTLSMTGTASADTIIISAVGDQIRASLNGSTLDFPAASVKRIYIDAQGGDDSATISAMRRSTILGGDGSDSLHGSALDDSIDGGDGNDLIDSGFGSELAGDTLAGGAGGDSAEYGNRDKGLEFRIGENEIPPVFALTVVGEADVWSDLPETIVGTEYADKFEPTGPPIPTQMTLLGRGGDDIFNLPGRFVEDGGSGKDGFWAGSSTTILAGTGNDLIFMNEVPAVMDGGPGTDKAWSPYVSFLDLHGTHIERATVPGTVIGDDIAEVLFGERVTGNGGNDTITGLLARSNYLDGGDGDDYIQGQGSSDTIFGGAGNDVIAGAAGNDKIHGGDGDDTIVGGKGHDRLYGDAGDDQILARDHLRDTLYGGDGIDSATVDSAGTQKDLWSEIETLI